MKKSNKIVALFVGLAATIALTSSFAKNGIQFLEINISEDPPGVYIPCLGENVIADWNVRAVYHEFVTPSGTFHVVDNWFFTTQVTGLVTGRMWFGRNSSPLQVNIGPGESEQWVWEGVVKPVTGDGPMWKIQAMFKVTVTANGDLAVLREPPLNFGDGTRCIGKN